MDEAENVLPFSSLQAFVAQCLVQIFQRRWTVDDVTYLAIEVIQRNPLIAKFCSI